MSDTNQTLGKYQIHEELGHGGFATVYRAHDPDLGIDVALKVLDANYARDPALVQRFRAEARVTARLHHPNIAWIINIDQADNRIFIAMQYVAGHNLHDWLKTKGLLPFEQIATLIQQVGDALDYAHAQRVIHRDVKPSNIIVDEAGHATLTDFGIVKAFEATTIQTTSGAVLGTPSYSSPEQAESKPLDNRSDLFSLAVVAYELLTGKVPFEADTVPSLYYKIVHEAVCPPSQINARVAAPIEAVLLKALAKDREQRYGTGQEFAQALKAAIEQAEHEVVDSHHQQANRYFEQADFNAAESELKQALAINPASVEALALLDRIAQQRDLRQRYQQLTASLGQVQTEAAAFRQSAPDWPDPDRTVQHLLGDKIATLETRQHTQPWPTKIARIISAIAVIITVASLVVANTSRDFGNTAINDLGNQISTLSIGNFGVGLGVGLLVAVGVLYFITRRKSGRFDQSSVNG